MGKPLTPEQRTWLADMSKALGAPPNAGVASPVSATSAVSASPTVGAPPTVSAAPPPISLQFPPRPGDPLGLPGLKIDPKTLEEMKEKWRKEAEKRKQDAKEALDQARKWLLGLPKEKLMALSYPEILATIKDDYPAVNDLEKPKDLMDMVDKVLTDTRYLFDKGLVGNPRKLAMEKVIAAYIAALPKEVKARVKDGGITLVLIGFSATAEAEAAAKKDEKFEFKNKDYTIHVSNAAWQALDPALRAKWKGLNDEATALEKLKAAITSLKKEWETSTSKVEVEARIKDLEAEFKGRWDTLKETINANAKLTTDGLKASITESKDKIKDPKAGVELEAKLEEMSIGLKAFASSPDLKTALSVTGSAEKITAKIEAEAIKSGTVVTLSYEKSLKEVKEQIALQIKQGDANLAATLSKEAVKLDDTLKAFQNSPNKDFEAVKGLEDGLHKLQLEVKAGFTAGNFKVSAGGKVASGGEVGGKAEVELMLKKGIRFEDDGQSQKIKFTADVSNKGYVFALMFSVGEMPEIEDVNKANAEADKKIRELYDVVKETRIRDMNDAKKIQESLSEVLKPLKKSVAAMKKANKKKIAVELGITITGEFSDNGRMPPPVPGFGLRVLF